MMMMVMMVMMLMMIMMMKIMVVMMAAHCNVTMQSCLQRKLHCLLWNSYLTNTDHDNCIYDDDDDDDPDGGDCDGDGVIVIKV